MWHDLKKFIRAYVWPRKWKFGAVQLMHVAAVALILVPPMLIRHIIDAAIPGADYRLLMFCAGGSLAVYALWALITGLKMYWGHEVSQSVTSDVRNDLYGHVQKLSMSFHDNTKTGELLSRIVDDINITQEFVHHGPETLLIGVVTVLGTTGILFYLDSRLALAALAVLPALALFTRVLATRMWRQFREVRKTVASLSEVVEENLTGIQVIQAYVSEDREAGNVSRANDGIYRSRMGAMKYICVMHPGALLINNVALAIVLLYGGSLAIRQTMTIGTLTAFVFYLGHFLRPLMRLMMMTETAGQFFASIERFSDYMAIEPDIADRESAVGLDDVRGELRLENVHFTYDTRPVLHGIDLAAKPGQMVALVGPSGAGKTTIIQLIPRFYEPYEGRVLVDGVDVRDLKLRSLRSHIGMVLQDDFLFSGSVADNIGYGRPGASREEIVEAAEQANAAPFVEELPDGYDTEIGKRGVKLSEGQKQRLSIARALLKNPPILLLDEATSSVDTETERLIQEAIEHLRAGRTTIAIAHRLSTILEADQILFIDHGRIVERGTHAELMQKDGQYARFYKIQFGELDLVARRRRA